jgi:hypothetical protein
MVHPDQRRELIGTAVERAMELLLDVKIENADPYRVALSRLPPPRTCRLPRSEE